MAMLSTLSPDDLTAMLSTLEHSLRPWPEAQRVFCRIADTRRLCPDMTYDLYAGHEDAIALAHRLGIPVADETPQASFSWDGQAVRTKTETAVLLHEIAHWQIAPEDRRTLPDFGLGAGPETGRVAEADAARCVDDATKEEEENLASLLGILWEVDLGGLALIAFCEQNWLELYDRPGTAQHFTYVLQGLSDRGLTTPDGHPCAAERFTSAA